MMIAAYSFITKEIIDNGAVLKPSMDGVEKYLQFSNLNLLKIVFLSSVGSWVVPSQQT